MPRERLPFRPHDLLIAALCLVLSSAATGQAASFERLRAAFEKELASGDFEARKAAIEQLAELGHPDVARFLVDRVRGAFRDSENMRAAHAEAAVRQSDLKRELDRVSRLVGQGKLGRKATEDAERDHQKAVEETKRLAAKLKEEEKVHEVLRRAVGWVLERCTGGHQDAAIRIVMDAYRGTKDPGETVEILRMMAWIDHPKVREFLDERVRDKDATVRFAAVRAFEERGGIPAIKAARAVLKDPVWQIRAQAVRLLRQAGGKDAALALAEVLEREDGRLIGDAMAALRQLTGQDFHANPHLWRDWIEKNGHELAAPTETANAAPPPRPSREHARESSQRRGGTGFYGIETTSKNLVYVIDFSGSMAQALAGQREEARNGDMGPAKVNGPRKVDGVVTELLRSIDSLPSDATFNVVLFSTDVTLWSATMQRATGEAKASIRAWVLARGPTGSTNLFEGLERAFEFAGRGTFDKRYKTTVDTIMLLSDGQPSAGRLQAPDDIIREIGSMNELRRLAIHCIGLGRFINVNFLEQLARRNDGEFVHVTK